MMDGFEIPPVPAIINWIAAGCAILTAIVGACIFVWRWFLRDWWATQTKERALARFLQIGADFNRVNALRDNTPALVSTATNCIVCVVSGLGMLAIGGALFGLEGFFIALLFSGYPLVRGFDILLNDLKPLQLTSDERAKRFENDMRKVFDRAKKVGVTGDDVLRMTAKSDPAPPDELTETDPPPAAVGIAALVPDNGAARKVAEKMGLPLSPPDFDTDPPDTKPRKTGMLAGSPPEKPDTKPGTPGVFARKPRRTFDD